MKELTVISGKGGTGKTSLVAAFAVLADGVVVADCDVDAADLHMLLAPRVGRREAFVGGSRARIVADRCAGCGKCEEACRFEAVAADGPGNDIAAKTWRVDPIMCEGCGVCVLVCPADAIEFGPVANGEWFISQTRCGPMVHARLEPGEGNSGKLVSLVRREAKRVAEQDGLALVLVDGSPGIGCPVIASIAGADAALVVTEPTQSGLHDMDRAVALAGRLGIPTAVCVNKWDLNAELADRIEAHARRHGAAVVPRARYDPAVTQAQIRGLSVVEHVSSGVTEDVKRIWSEVSLFPDGAVIA